MSLSINSAHTAVSVQMASLKQVILDNTKGFGTFGGNSGPNFSGNAAMPTPATGVGTQLDINA